MTSGGALLLAARRARARLELLEVEGDDRGRMTGAALRRALEASARELLSLVAATAGTTNTRRDRRARGDRRDLRASGLLDARRRRLRGAALAAPERRGRSSPASSAPTRSSSIRTSGCCAARLRRAAVPRPAQGKAAFSQHAEYIDAVGGPVGVEPVRLRDPSLPARSRAAACGSRSRPTAPTVTRRRSSTASRSPGRRRADRARPRARADPPAGALGGRLSPAGLEHRRLRGVVRPGAGVGADPDRADELEGRDPAALLLRAPGDDDRRRRGDPRPRSRDPALSRPRRPGGRGAPRCRRRRRPTWRTCVEALALQDRGGEAAALAAAADRRDRPVARQLGEPVEQLA